MTRHFKIQIILIFFGNANLHFSYDFFSSQSNFFCTFYYFIIILSRFIGLVGRVFANGSGDLRSVPGHVIPNTFKMVLNASLINTQQYKVRIKGKVEQFRERSSTLLYTLV